MVRKQYNDGGGGGGGSVTTAPSPSPPPAAPPSRPNGLSAGTRSGSTHTTTSSSNGGSSFRSSPLRGEVSTGMMEGNTSWTVGATDASLMSVHGATDHSSSRSLASNNNNNNNHSSNEATTLSTLSAAIRSASAEPAPSHTHHTNPYTSNYEDRLLHRPNIAPVESILAASCQTLGFDIAEMWLRTSPKTHQLVHTYLSPPGVGTQHDERVHSELVDVYYGDKSAERKHRLSPALCKRAKEEMDVVWVTAHTQTGAEELKCAINDVRTAVAVPVCQEASRTNVTLIFFSVRRAVMRPSAVEFLVHMSLAAATAAVEVFAEEIFLDPAISPRPHTGQMSQSDHVTSPPPHHPQHTHTHTHTPTMPHHHHPHRPPARISPFGAKLDLKWSDLSTVEYLTDGGNSWIHTGVVSGRPVVIKTLKPECQDVALAINEIEGELEIHSRLRHEHIVELIGAGTTSKGNRFVVLERLDGGTLSQVLGYDTRIRDRRRRFWKRKHMSYAQALLHAKSLADALWYCHERAIVGCMCLHRDLKPDNIGFTLEGRLKLLDFGLARIVEHASPFSEEVYYMSGETGSLRYMAPEVADSRPYNHKADVYSFGIILWELLAYKKPYDGMNRESFYARVVKGDERPQIHKKWPKDVCKLMTECWSADMNNRPNFDEIVERIDKMIATYKGVTRRPNRKGIVSLIDRHSTWF